MSVSDDAFPDYPPVRDPRYPLNPPPAYAAFRTGPVRRVRVRDGSCPWLITRYEDVRQALADESLSLYIRQSGYPHVYPTSILRRDRPLAYLSDADSQYQAQRSFVLEEFTPTRVQALRSHIEAVVDEAATALLRKPAPVDLMSDFILPVTTRIISHVLGVPLGDGARLHALSRVVGSRVTTAEQAAPVLDELHNYFRRLVDIRMREPHDDAMGRFVTRHVRSGRVNPDDAAATFQILFHQGHGTPAFTMSLGFIVLMQHPDQLAELRDTLDEDLVDRSVHEIIRFCTSVHNGRPRVATADLVVGGEPIPAGDSVLLQLDSANRDGTVYDEPDCFDIHRPRHRHLGYGSGAHHCAGRALADLELRVVFRTLLRRAPGLRIAVPLDEVGFTFNENLYGARHLMVAW